MIANFLTNVVHYNRDAIHVKEDLRSIIAQNTHFVLKNQFIILTYNVEIK